MSSPNATTTSADKSFTFELISAENAIASEIVSSGATSFSPSTTLYLRRNQSPLDSTIRHAGRAHIRGKIRRIWRPRYLELCDKGLLRYFELPPTADVTMPEEADWQHVNMVIKDTLVIHHARIIDVTTLRDLHVGLPRGSYGFLFRGQRLYVNELLAKRPLEPDAPREYFCAVSTLEEAQTWVIALQWAAAMCKKNHIAEAFFGDEVGDWASDQRASNRIDRSNPLQCGLSQSTTCPSSSPTHGRATTKPNESAMAISEKKVKSGRVLVTKVHCYRIIRDATAAPALLWEVAYEVALLLVQNHKVEERRILLTARDLEFLLEDLERANDDPLLQSFYGELKRQTQDLPRFQSSRRLSCSPQGVSESVTKVDGILRSITTEPSALNSGAMKSTLGLDIEQPTILDVSWWKLLLGTGKANETKRVIFREVRPIPCDVGVQEWVRVWLIQTSRNYRIQLAMSSQWQTQAQFLVLRRPLFLMSGVGMAAALLYPFSQVYQRNMVSLSVRADILAASWCVAYWFGQRKGAHQAKQERISDLRSSARGIPRVSTIAPVMGLMPASTPISTPQASPLRQQMSPVASPDDNFTTEASDDAGVDGEDLDSIGDEVQLDENFDNIGKLSSPLPFYSDRDQNSGWSEPADPSIFRVRGMSYLEDRIKVPSGPSPFRCRGVDVWMTDNPQRHIARHPSVLGGKLKEKDTFLVNFLLPFGNFVSYHEVPSLENFPNKQVADVWTKFIKGDQQYRDARLKLLPVVIEGPWIVKAAVGNGTAPALLGKAIPLQYFFQQPDGKRKGVYEVDVIITASTIAKGILSVVKGHTNSLAIAFALIIEGAKQEELPETVLCSFQVHFLNLDDCPMLPKCNLDEIKG